MASCQRDAKGDEREREPRGGTHKESGAQGAGALALAVGKPDMPGGGRVAGGERDVRVGFPAP